LSLAFPVSGLLVSCAMALVGMAAPSSDFTNQFTDLLHIYNGIAFLLPVPLTLLTLIFLVNGMRRLRREPAIKGLGIAVIGLAISTVSTVMFVATAIFFPRL
jgi:hypothetical protein